MSSFFQNIKATSLLVQLIIINVAVFLILNIASNFQVDIMSYVGVPSNLAELCFKPWTLITHMIAHKDLGHVFYNMMSLFFFSTIFLQILDEKKLLFLYVFGSLSGIALYLTFAQFVPSIVGSGYAFGASASVMAIAVAIGTYMPEYRFGMMFFGEVVLKWVVLIVFVLSVIIDFSVNTGGKIAHLGGSVFGLIYALQLKKGNDISLWFQNLIWRRKKTKLKVVHYKKVDDYTYNEIKRDEEAELNYLLDKINKSGYESLSKKEKETLHRLSTRK